MLYILVQSVRTLCRLKKNKSDETNGQARLGRKRKSPALPRISKSFVIEFEVENVRTLNFDNVVTFYKLHSSQH